MSKVIKEVQEAFDGDFGEVAFDHKPTPEDIMLVKLKLVAKAQRDSSDKEWIKKLKKLPSVFGIGDVLLDAMEYKKKLEEFFKELE